MRIYLLLILIPVIILIGCTQTEQSKQTIPFEKYHNNGKPSILGQKVQSTGKATGEWKFYAVNGVLKETGYYRNGKEHGEWNKYDEQGNVISTSYYSNGKNYRTVIPWRWSVLSPF